MTGQDSARRRNHCFDKQASVTVVAGAFLRVAISGEQGPATERRSVLRAQSEDGQVVIESSDSKSRLLYPNPPKAQSGRAKRLISDR